MDKKTSGILLVITIILSSCAPFNVHEAAHFSHKCASKHGKRFHRYQGKLYYSYLEIWKDYPSYG